MPALHFDCCNCGELLIEDLGFLKFTKIVGVHELFEVQLLLRSHNVANLSRCVLTFILMLRTIKT